MTRRCLGSFPSRQEALALMNRLYAENPSRMIILEWDTDPYGLSSGWYVWVE